MYRSDGRYLEFSSKAEDATEVLDKIRSNTQRVFNTTKDRQQRKFEKLLREKQASVSPPTTSSVDKTNWVVNLSSRSLLTKGLNFAVTPADIPATEIVAKVMNQQSDNWTRNEQTQCGELLTPSFNRLSHRSLTSRRNSRTPLKA